MRERTYVCKLDKWLSEKIFDESWSSVFLTLIGTSIAYAVIYYLPEIMFYFEGYVTDSGRQKWRVMWVGALCLVILFFTVLKTIRLLRKKTFGGFKKSTGSDLVDSD